MKMVPTLLLCLFMRLEGLIDGNTPGPAGEQERHLEWHIYRDDGLRYERVECSDVPALTRVFWEESERCPVRTAPPRTSNRPG